MVDNYGNIRKTLFNVDFGLRQVGAAGRRERRELWSAAAVRAARRRRGHYCCRRLYMPSVFLCMKQAGGCGGL